MAAKQISLFGEAPAQAQGARRGRSAASAACGPVCKRQYSRSFHSQPTRSRRHTIGNIIEEG